jgi:stringent starvation protein B
MSSPERPSKQQAFLALLREGWTSLHLDARRPGVIVPAAFRREAHLVLQYGHDLPIPIPDLEVDDYGVRATLSFSRTAHLTVIPWSAVYVVACDDGRGVLYSEDVPEDVPVIASRQTVEGDERDAGEVAEAEMQASEGPAEVEADEVVLPVPRPARLRSVPADAAAAALSEADQPPLVARRRRRPQLRLVK